MSRLETDIPPRTICQKGGRSDVATRAKLAIKNRRQSSTEISPPDTASATTVAPYQELSVRTTGGRNGVVVDERSSERGSGTPKMSVAQIAGVLLNATLTGLREEPPCNVLGACWMVVGGHRDNACTGGHSVARILQVAGQGGKQRLGEVSSGKPQWLGSSG
ncbi:hypothetical protein B0H13DRAFT_2511670 [Mycena leptocephala]|nr:hypothetical protein B0H13DRAFT_2511670 [Mycena leptocephala]